VQAQTLAPYGASLVVSGAQFSPRKITAVGALTDRLPNKFFGVSESDQITLSLDNLDGELTPLLNEEIRGKPIRIRCYDEGTGDDLVVYDGVIEAAPILDTVDLSISRTNFSALSMPLPARRIVESTLGLTETTASDTGTPVPIIFGSVQGAPLTLVRSDDVLSEYDYLVGEGDICVDSVQKDGTQAWTARADLLGITASAPGVLPTFTFQIPAGYFSNVDLNGLTLSVWDGPAANRELKIVAVNSKALDTFGLSFTIVVSVEGDISGITSTNSVLLREYMHIREGGRTYLRFFHPQIRDGARMNIRCTATKYSSPKKNRLLDTELYDSQYHGENRAAPWTINGPASLIGSVPARFTAPDLLSAVQKLTGLTTGRYIQQVCVIGDAQLTDGNAWTFSIWIEKETLTALRISIISNGAGATTTTFDATTSTAWQRISVTKTTGWGSGATQATIRIERAPAGSGTAVRLWGAQFEQSAVPTYYEPVDLSFQGARAWTIPDAIREILSAPYGLNQPIDIQSFDQANETLSVGASASDWMFLKAQGRIPYLDGTETVPAKEVLDELCQLRGIRLSAVGGAWSISVDAPGRASEAAFGNEETPYRNIIEVQPLKRQALTEIVQSLQVQYGQEASVDGNAVTYFYPYVLEKTGLATTGIAKTIPLRFVRDTHTADRFLQYYAAWLQLLDTNLALRVGIAGRHLVAGSLVDVAIPRFQPENRVKASEDFSDVSAWIYSAHVTGLGGQALSPDRRSYRASRITFASGWSGQSVAQTISNAPTNRLVTFTCWVRADTPVEGIEVQLQSNTETHIVPVLIGVAWKKIQIVQAFGSAATSPCTVRFANTSAFGASTAFYTFGAQVTYDYLRPYAKTTTTAILPQTSFLVTTMVRDSLVTSTLDLIAYDETRLFAYTPSSFPVRLSPPAATDTRTDPPLMPQSLSVPETGIDSAAGITNSWARIQFLMPSNATGVLLEYQKTDELGWTMITTIPSSDAIPDTVAQAVLYNLVSKASYTIRAIAYNAFNNYSASAIAVFTAA
jgi:hypothetical protein